MRTIAILLLTAFLTRPALAGDEAKEGVKSENAVNSSTRGQQKAPDQPPQFTKPTCPLATLVNAGGCAPKVENQAARLPLEGRKKLVGLAEAGQVVDTSIGGSQSLSADALNEVVQILGQIVVDRASQEGFRLLQQRLIDLLTCEGNGKTILPTTCQTLESLRLQDIASAPQALLSALLADLSSRLFDDAKKEKEFVCAEITSLCADGKNACGEIAKVCADSTKTRADVNNVCGDAKTAAGVSEICKDAEKSSSQLIAFLIAVQRDIAPLLIRADHGIDSRVASLTTSLLRTKGMSIVKAQAAVASDPKLPPCTGSTNQERANESLGFAAAATGACLASSDPAATCPAGQVVAKLFADVCGSGGDMTIERAAESLATDIVTALTALNDQTKPDAKRRLHAANDGLFDYLCLSVDFEGGCPPSATPPTIQGIFGGLHTIFGSAIDGDKLETVVQTAALLKATVYKDLEQKKYQRGVRLLSGVLDYTLTFDPAKANGSTSKGADSGTAADDLHSQRTKILESLTADMTDRTGRVGETIVSVGGALRVALGRWIRKDGKDAFYGPISLPARRGPRRLLRFRSTWPALRAHRG